MRTADRHPDLHPELRRMFRFAPTAPLGNAGVRAITRAATPLLPAPRLPEGVTRESVRFADRGRGLRIFRTAAPTGGALVWFHGGGMMIGSAAQDDHRCAQVAHSLGAVVVSVDYRFAPEHPYPAPLDDAEEAWDWVSEHAPDLDLDPSRLAIGGQSAGGCLAAALAQRLRDRGRDRPAAQWLFCPMLDDRSAADRSLDRVRYAVWDNRSNHAAWRAYLGVEPGADAVSPDAAPARRDDLSGLPPAWIGVGTSELFHDEACDYARRLAEAGVPVVLDEVPGAPHAFESFAGRTAVARDYLSRATAWLGGALAA